MISEEQPSEFLSLEKVFAMVLRSMHTKNLNPFRPLVLLWLLVYCFHRNCLRRKFFLEDRITHCWNSRPRRILRQPICNCALMLWNNRSISFKGTKHKGIGHICEWNLNWVIHSTRLLIPDEWAFNLNSNSLRQLNPLIMFDSKFISGNLPFFLNNTLFLTVLFFLVKNCIK